MRRNWCAFLSILFSPALLADGLSLGKIYYPYVQPLESEVEYQALAFQPNSEDGQQWVVHRLGVGTGFSDRWYGEASVSWSDQTSSLSDAYELELIHQLTEQGEFSVDWGVLYELEREANAWEASVGLLASTELDRWQLTANLFLIREWGSEIDDEWETAMGLQAKYRYSPAFEPGIEFFSGEDTRAVGPSMQGLIKLNPTDKFRWQTAFLFGTIDNTPDHIVKLVLEYEFF